jgi:signal transduction histidine kinase
VVLLAVYLIGVGYLIMLEREKMPRAVAELDRVHNQEEQLLQLNMSVARAIFTVNEHYHGTSPEAAAQVVALEVEAVLAALQGMEKVFPVLGNDHVTLARLADELHSAPGRGALAELRASLHKLVADLDLVTARVREGRTDLLARYRQSYDVVTVQMLVVGLLGIILTGGAMTLFFTRLAWDLRKVQARALEVARGFRGKPLAVTRSDELGALMEAVNDIQRQLRTREMRIEVARQQSFYQEKMAAVGSLAAAVAHELNNPLSAIMGVAQAMVDEQGGACCKGGRTGVCHPELVLEQARRVSQITRQLSEFSVVRSPEASLLDLNGVVRSTCTFVAYDKRFRGVELKLALDSQLPAITVVADHLTQVLTNLLFNAADAMEDPAGRRPAITVSTGTAGAGVFLSVADNGVGIDQAVLGRIFDEYFTTKPSGKGTGLGLAVCKSLIESAGGEISVESTLGVGTTVTVRLPRNPDPGTT